MRIKRISPARKFRCGHNNVVQISHCANIQLKPDEQITFVTKTGKEHDFVAKSWGFYSTPSMNGRLLQQGFKTALVSNEQGKIFIHVVDKSRMADFKKYMRKERGWIIEWLDQRPLKKERKRTR